jgi:hypothetical protein
MGARSVRSIAATLALLFLWLALAGAEKPRAHHATGDYSLWRDSKEGDTGPLGGAIRDRHLYGAMYFKVLQITGAHTAKVHCKCEVVMTEEELKDYHAAFGTMQIEWDFLLKSAAVADLHEEQTLARIPGYFRHEGRKQYDSALGAVHTIDIIADAPRPKLEPPKEKPKPKPPEPDWRTWTDASGEHKTEAQFKGLAFGKVKLLKRDGQVATVSLDDLSEADREWIRRRVR